MMLYNCCRDVLTVEYLSGLIGAHEVGMSWEAFS